MLEEDSGFLNLNDYAVVVGIIHYPEFGNLRGAIEDAKAFYKWLTNKHGGSVPDENCQFVESRINPEDEFPQRPIQAQIDLAFQAIWKKMISSGRQARRFYFYFNGHGIGIRYDNIALLMANFDTRFFRDSALSSESYLQRIVSSGRFQEVVFFLDCCRSQLLGVNGLPPTFNWPADSFKTGETTMLIGYASEYQSSAFEAKINQREIKTDDDGFMGHFTKALLRGLNGAAADLDTGRITAHSLKAYLEYETPRIAQTHNHNQRARVVHDFASSNPTYFNVTDFQMHAQYHISLTQRGGNVILMSGKAEIIKSKAADPLPWNVVLPADKYILMEIESGDKFEFIVIPSVEYSDVSKILF